MTTYNRVAADDRLSLSIGARAYLDYARGCALVFAGKTKEALAYTAGFVGAKPEFRNTSTYWRALFLLGNLDHTQETALLELGASDCPDASLRLDFALRLGQLAFCHQQDDKAVKLFTCLRSSAKPDDYRAVAAGKYLELIEARSPRTFPIPSR